MAPRILLCCSVALLLTGCGAEDDGEPAAPGEVARLVVAVDADGRGPEPPKEIRFSCGSPRESSVCAEAAKLDARDLGPVEPDLACTDLFGGPETATIRGRLNGRAVDERFARSNGCEIARWDKAAGLLEAVG